MEVSIRIQNDHEEDDDNDNGSLTNSLIPTLTSSSTSTSTTTTTTPSYSTVHPHPHPHQHQHPHTHTHTTTTHNILNGSSNMLNSTNNHLVNMMSSFNNNNNSSSSDGENTTSTSTSSGPSSGSLYRSFLSSPSSTMGQLLSQRGHSLTQSFFNSDDGDSNNLNQSNNNVSQNIDTDLELGLHTTTTTTTNTAAASGGGGANNNVNININNNTFNDGTQQTTGSSTRLDMHYVIKWLEQSYPFMIILLVIFLYKHRQGILMFLWQQAVFTQANQALKTQVALQDKRNVGVLSWLIVILSSNIATTYLFFGSSELWRSLIMLSPRIPIDIYSAFWVAVLNDFMVRFITMIVKALCVIVIGHKPPHKRRAQLYTVIEVTSHLYRCLLPISIWSKYFHSLHDDGEHILGSLMVGLYFTFKITHLVERSKQWFQTARAFILHEVLYGHKATKEQVAAVDDLCAICQEKMVSPIVLRCDHVFCEDCVSQWFEREKTCPLCRAAIATAGNRTHSDGTTSFLVQLF
ncbi:hypothetical protein SAMD00019534_121840, partial [Acytostelium subglobosum LB1]|uniref:hypothetical protein n=1 Tax=Acytostelium subglobosum LB1 TaxID=1410327 RepID=UPI000644F665